MYRGRRWAGLCLISNAAMSWRAFTKAVSRRAYPPVMAIFGMRGKFTRKAHEQMLRGVECTVILATTSLSTNWWLDWVHGKALVWPIQRVRFVGHEQDFPKDLALLVYALGLEPGYKPRMNWKGTKST